MPAAQAPLPRSLDPLPGESLPGFLLRLTHRLDLTPYQLARRVTLISPDDPHARASAAHLLTMQSARLQAFADVTRMTPADADALTLRSYADRYPALARALVRPGSIPRPRRLSQPWLLADPGANPAVRLNHQDWTLRNSGQLNPPTSSLYLSATCAEGSTDLASATLRCDQLG
ncbi:TniQ family protein [Streptomyces daghestanicus]|uniref:TniQ domain-containing protein n=1 Tax=Streptomyces daghestanicus TaxID=66885 RepID=A0ABQ3PUH9_9ACTN|nr:hypothetical protein GCM10010259_37070 [Streptomyces daghestanicus]GHI28686.1 hypothetical protein Sdagh_04160 [Streptomyces daghestanicus]